MAPKKKTLEEQLKTPPLTPAQTEVTKPAHFIGGGNNPGFASAKIGGFTYCLEPASTTQTKADFIRLVQLCGVQFLEVVVRGKATLYPMSSVTSIETGWSTL